MYKTIELLNMVKSRYSLASDYALAKKLSVSPQVISRYMNKGYILDDKVAFTVAHILALDPAYLVACMHFERAERKEDTKLISFWMDEALSYKKSDNLSHSKFAATA